MESQQISELLIMYKELPKLVQERLITILGAEGILEEKIRAINGEFASSYSVKKLTQLFTEQAFGPKEISLVLNTFHVYESLLPENRTSLVWSGPNLRGVPLRRTAQVIIEMIDNAKTSLFLSSFSFYKVKHIIKHLILADERGVSISLLLETPQSSHYKIKIDPLTHLDDRLKE